MDQHELDVKRGTALVRKCQQALGRELTNGERRDLLADNTRWDRERINRVVGALGDCE